MEKLKGFENYFIDKEGNIYTKDKKLMTGKFVDNTGYYQIVLRKNGKRSYQRLHRLIAINKISKEKFIFPSIRKCSEELKINRKTLSSILFNNKTNNYNYEFKIA